MLFINIDILVRNFISIGIIYLWIEDLFDFFFYEDIIDNDCIFWLIVF